MSCRGIAKKIKNTFQIMSEIETETFLELFRLEKYRILGLDFLNCILISKNIKPIPDKCIKYLLNFDIIKSYSPKKARITK